MASWWCVPSGGVTAPSPAIPSTPAAGAATFMQALFARKTLLPSVCLSCALRDGSYMGRKHPAAFLNCTVFPSKIRCTSGDTQGSHEVLLVASKGTKSEYKSSCLPLSYSTATDSPSTVLLRG